MYSALSETLKITGKFTAQDVNATEHSELSILIRDCIAGDQRAQKILYDQYAPKAYGVIKRYLYNDDNAADELLNDSFFKILTRLNQYNFNGAFEGWIRRIVVNTVTDYLRRKIKNEPTKEVQPEDAFVKSDATDKLSHKELLKLVQQLPDAQRAVFNLYVFENYLHKEIAVILNINENNSRWHLNDARRRLREKISSNMK
jgi:RNA polymerase sigma factor (sigma-70 family)